MTLPASPTSAASTSFSLSSAGGDGGGGDAPAAPAPAPSARPGAPPALEVLPGGGGQGEPNYSLRTRDAQPATPDPGAPLPIANRQPGQPAPAAPAAPAQPPGAAAPAPPAPPGAPAAPAAPFDPLAEGYRAFGLQQPQQQRVDPQVAAMQQRYQQLEAQFQAFIGGRGAAPGQPQQAGGRPAAPTAFDAQALVRSVDERVGPAPDPADVEANARYRGRYNAELAQSMATSFQASAQQAAEQQFNQLAAPPAQELLSMQAQQRAYQLTQRFGHRVGVDFEPMLAERMMQEVARGPIDDMRARDIAVDVYRGYQERRLQTLYGLAQSDPDFQPFYIAYVQAKNGKQARLANPGGGGGSQQSAQGGGQRRARNINDPNWLDD